MATRRAGNRGRGNGGSSTPPPPLTPPVSPTPATPTRSYSKWLKITLAIAIVIAVIKTVTSMLSGTGNVSGFFISIVVIGGILLVLSRWLKGEKPTELFSNENWELAKKNRKPILWAIGIIWALGFGGIWQLATEPGEFFRDFSAEVTSFITGNTNERDPKRDVFAADEQGSWYFPIDIVGRRPDRYCEEATPGSYEGFTPCVNAHGVENTWVNPAAATLTAATYWRDPRGDEASSIRACEGHLRAVYTQLTGDINHNRTLRSGTYPNGQPIVYWGQPSIDGNSLGFEYILCNTNTALGTLVLGNGDAYEAYWTNQERQSWNTCNLPQGRSYMYWPGETCYLLNPGDRISWTPARGRIEWHGRTPGDLRIQYRVNIGSETRPNWVVYDPLNEDHQTVSQVEFTNTSGTPTPLFYKVWRS